MAANALLTWDPSFGANSYRVEYKLQSDSSWTLFNSSVTGTSISVTNLGEGLAYDFRITSNCTTGSAGGLVISGTTPCKDVQSLTVTFAGVTGNLSWSKKPNAISYGIEYKLQSTGTWTTATGSPLNNTGQPDPVTFSIPGLQAGSAYDFRVKVNCVSGTSTGSVVSATSACLDVTNLALTFS